MPGSRPSFPSDPHPRRLGVGGGPSGSERALKAQLVIAVGLGFTVLAVLLYLWRRPSGTEHAAQLAADSASASAGAPALAPIVRTRVEETKPPPARVKLGAVQHVKCGATARLTASDNNLCDSLPFFEQALTKAVQDSVDCAPKQKEEGSISYVLVVEFPLREIRMYAGRSGSWRGKAAKKAVECVKHAIPAPVWDTMAHQYRYYALALVATYPAEPASDTAQEFK